MPPSSLNVNFFQAFSLAADQAGLKIPFAHKNIGIALNLLQKSIRLSVALLSLCQLTKQDSQYLFVAKI